MPQNIYRGARNELTLVNFNCFSESAKGNLFSVLLGFWNKPCLVRNHSQKAHTKFRAQNYNLKDYH